MVQKKQESFLNKPASLSENMSQLKVLKKHILHSHWFN
jgi:hypothetical protein